MKKNDQKVSRLDAVINVVEGILDAGITARYAMVLLAICKSDWDDSKALSISDLADQIRTSKANMTGLIDHMEKMELVRRYADSSDRRKIMVEVLAKGEGIISNLKEKIW